MRSTEYNRAYFIAGLLSEDEKNLQKKDFISLLLLQKSKYFVQIREKSSPETLSPTKGNKIRDSL